MVCARPSRAYRHPALTMRVKVDRSCTSGGSGCGDHSWAFVAAHSRFGHHALDLVNSTKAIKNPDAKQTGTFQATARIALTGTPD